MADKKEQQILEAVVELINQQGLVGVTTKLIAQTAGVNEVTLFRRFGNKDNLVKAALKYQISKFSEETLYYSGDLKEDLIDLVTGYQQIWLNRGGFVVNMLSEIIRYPALCEEINPLELITQKAIKLLSRYQTQGKLSQANPMLMVAELIGPVMVLGLAQHAARLKELPKIDPKIHVEHFLANYCA